MRATNKENQFRFDLRNPYWFFFFRGDYPKRPKTFQQHLHGHNVGRIVCENIMITHVPRAPNSGFRCLSGCAFRKKKGNEKKWEDFKRTAIVTKPRRHCWNEQKTFMTLIAFTTNRSGWPLVGHGAVPVGSGVLSDAGEILGAVNWRCKGVDLEALEAPFLLPQFAIPVRGGLVSIQEEKESETRFQAKNPQKKKKKKNNKKSNHQPTNHRVKRHAMQRQQWTRGTGIPWPRRTRQARTCCWPGCRSRQSLLPQTGSTWCGWAAGGCTCECPSRRLWHAFQTCVACNVRQRRA